MLLEKEMQSGEKRDKMNKLKTCPFCGGTNITMYSLKDPSLHGFIHICDGVDDCMVKIESRLFSTEEEAVEAWNRRVDDGRPD